MNSESPHAVKSSLRLFVIGPSSGDPEQWNDYDDIMLILASTAEEASSMDEFERTAHMVEMSRPRVLSHIRAIF